MKKKKPKILIVDDEPSIRSTLKNILIAENYKVETAHCGEKAIQFIRKEDFDLVLLDMKLPDFEGTGLLRFLNKESPWTIRIIITGYPTLHNAVESLNEGADAYLIKPVDIEELLKTIQAYLKVQEENRQLLKERNLYLNCSQTKKMVAEMYSI